MKVLSSSSATSQRFSKNKMTCDGIGMFPSSAYSAPVNSPSVSGSIPSACNPALGWRSNVTGSFPACSRKGFGSAATVASTSADATAHSLSQSRFTSQVWRAIRAGATFRRFASFPPLGCRQRKSAGQKAKMSFNSSSVTAPSFLTFSRSILVLSPTTEISLDRPCRCSLSNRSTSSSPSF